MEVRAPLRPSKQLFKVDVVSSKKGHHVPMVNGKFLHSRYDPEEEARKWVGEMVAKKPDARAVVVLGMGFAYHIQAIRDLLPAAPIVVLEPISEIVSAYARTVARNIDNVFLWPAPSPQQTVDALVEIVSPTLVNHTLILAHPPSIELSSEAYRQILSSIHSTLDMIAMSLTTGWGFGFEWIKNGIQNVRRLPGLPFLNQALEISAGRSATLVIGAGPSLDDSWDIIRRAQAVRLAVDTAIEPMERQGLYPHLAFSLDSQVENAQLIEKVEAANINLVVSLEVQPSVFDRPWRNLIVCNCDQGILSWLERRSHISAGSLKQGGSVATCAFDFARQMNSSTIYFAGIDLSFTGHTVYCQGTAYERRAIECPDSPFRFNSIEQRMYQMKMDRTERAVLGRQTQDNLYNYYRWLKDEIGRTQSPVVLLNPASLLSEFLPTDGAARILNENFPEADDPNRYQKKIPPNGFLRTDHLQDAMNDLRRRLEEFLTLDHFEDSDRLEIELQASDIRDVIETVVQPAIAVSRYERQKGSDGKGILKELRDRLAALLRHF